MIMVNATFVASGGNKSILMPDPYSVLHMETQTKPKLTRPFLARVGASRQVAIPKKLHDELGLTAGDIVEVERKGNQIVLTPKDIVEKGIAEGVEDLKKGRVYGPFSSVKDMLKSLHGAEKPRKKSKRAA